jgi:hypothetical protein
MNSLALGRIHRTKFAPLRCYILILRFVLLNTRIIRDSTGQTEVDDRDLR